MKKIFMLVALMATSLISNGILFGQEYIKTFNTVNDMTPIIKEWGTDRVMCCSNGDYSIFYKFTDASSAAQFESIINIEWIYDFVIVDDYVFFCGKKEYSGTWDGVLGYFSLNQFPNSPVTYLPVAIMKNFRKLVASGYSDRAMSFFLIGQDDENYDRVVQVVYTTYMGPPSWYVRTTTVMDPSPDELIFDDVASTDNYYIVTARLGSPIYYSDVDSAENHDTVTVENNDAPRYFNIGTGLILYFNKSVLFPASSLALCNYLTLPYGKVYDPILIDTCGSGDWFVVASKAEYKEDNPRLYVDAFNGFNDVYSVHLNGIISSYNLVDISYNHFSRNMDVVLHSPFYEASIILSLTHHMATSPTSVLGRIYPDYNITSLCSLNDIPDHYIAAGYSYDDRVTDPIFLRYKYTMVLWCAEIMVDNSIGQEIKPLKRIIEPDYTDLIHVPFEGKTNWGSCPISTICVNGSSNEE